MDERFEQIEGRNPVFEALEAGRQVREIWIGEGSRGAGVIDIRKKAKSLGVPVKEAPSSQITAMAHTKGHQGVIAVAAPIESATIEEILAAAERKGEPPFVVILDEIQDPHNLGALLRSADACGVHGIVVPKRRAVGLTATVAKVSAGAVEYVPVAQVVNLARALDDLKAAGVWIAGADMSGEVMWDADLSGPLGLVVGNEGNGLRRLVRERCDFLVSIPMAGRINSLNASVAGAVLMYEALRRRDGGKAR